MSAPRRSTRNRTGRSSADEENAGKQSELPAGDTEFSVHRESCKPKVDPVDIRNDVEEKDREESRSGFIESWWLR
jgi:hypothetical protein